MSEVKISNEAILKLVAAMLLVIIGGGYKLNRDVGRLETKVSYVLYLQLNQSNHFH